MNAATEPLRKRTNFYYPLLLLPKARRAAMERLYRFCREADDIADGPGGSAGKRRRLEELRRALRRGFRDGVSPHPFVGPLLSTALPLGLTRAPLETILDGCEQDAGRVEMRTFRELHSYALKVAGGPGLSSMEIFGFHDAPHRAYAEDLGVFLQLVNVVRDVAEDHALGRRYLPRDEWKRFGLPARGLPAPGPAWDAFVRFQLDRAHEFRDKAFAALRRRDRGRLSTAEAIADVYGVLHGLLRADPARPLSERVRIPAHRKAAAVLGAWARCTLWSLGPAS